MTADVIHKLKTSIPHRSTNPTTRTGGGTQTPIPLIDPVYNYPVSVRAYGQWGNPHC